MSIFSVAGAVKQLKNEMIAKLLADADIKAKVADRIYTLINPNDPRLYEFYNKLPFIGISFPESHVPDYYGSQQKDEDLKPRIWIYHENSRNKGQDLFDEILELADQVLQVLNYTRDFSADLEIIEARYSNFTGPFSAVTESHQYAAVVSFNIIYLRTTEEVLV